MKKNGDTKKAMANALRECMQTSPIDRISIKEITDVCGLNRQTFYYHFKDIYDLIKWMYVYDINEAMAETHEGETNEEMLRRLLHVFDKDRECHLAVYNSRNYYPNLRLEIIGSLTERLSPVFEPSFDHLGFDDDYREFLRRMYALVIFEFIERRARGNAFSSIDSFVESWFRTIESQFRGELLRPNKG
ncbi:MAG: TetR family transcriptional regulator [Eggerthellaceae bacterium]|nr:TetR family transcriptional regulator [Eggerthellaceae bacterium]